MYICIYIDISVCISTRLLKCPLSARSIPHPHSTTTLFSPSSSRPPTQLRRGSAPRARARSLMFIYISADGTQRILELEQALQLDLSNPICRHSSARGQGLMRSKKSNAAGGKLR